MSKEAAAPRAPSRRAALASRFGLPDLSGNGRFLAANAIDSLGNGLILAFTVVYFTRTTSLSLVEVGAGLTTGQLLSLPTPALIGPLVDRYGARAVVVAGNILSAVGFLGFLVSTAVWQIVLAQLVVQIGVNAYWTSSGALVVLAAKDGERPRWFAFLRALRNTGIGLGGAAAALAVGVASTAGLRAVVAANAVTFLVAAYLIARWRPSAAVSPQPSQEAEGAGAEDASGPRDPAPGYLTVLRDWPYLRLVAANLSFVLAAMVLSVLLAVYVTDSLRVGAWAVGVLVVLNTALIALVQTVASRWIERHRPARVIALAALLNAVAFALFAALAALPRWSVVAGLVLAIVVYTAAEILGSPPVSELSVALAPERARGRYLAVYQLSWSLGGAVAPVLLTSLLDQGPAWPWLFLAALSLLAVPAVLGLGTTPKAAVAASETADPAPQPPAAAPDSIDQPDDPARAARQPEPEPAAPTEGDVPVARKILLLEANAYAGEDLLNAAAELELEVYVATHADLYEAYRPALTEKITGTVFTDFADGPKALQDLVEFGRDQKVEAVVTAWEFLSPLAARTAAALGLPGHDPERADASRNKRVMAEAFEQHAVPVPRTLVAATYEEASTAIADSGLDYPLVVKPAENAGSVGVTVVDSADDLAEAVALAQKWTHEFPHHIPLDTTVLIQEYVGGDEFSVETVIAGGIAQHLAVTQKFTAGSGSRAELGHTVPAPLPTADRQIVLDAVGQALKALGLRDGVAHSEVKLDAGKAAVIEVGARPPGDNIMKLVHHALGVNEARAYLQAALGDLPDTEPTSDGAAAIRFLKAERAGSLTSVEGLPDSPAVVDTTLYVEAGGEVGDPHDNVGRVGHIILRADTPDRVNELAAEVLSAVRIEVA